MTATEFIVVPFLLQGRLSKHNAARNEGTARGIV